MTRNQLLNKIILWIILLTLIAGDQVPKMIMFLNPMTWGKVFFNSQRGGGILFSGVFVVSFGGGLLGIPTSTMIDHKLKKHIKNVTMTTIRVNPEMEIDLLETKIKSKIKYDIAKEVIKIPKVFAWFYNDGYISQEINRYIEALR